MRAEKEENEERNLDTVDIIFIELMGTLFIGSNSIRVMSICGDQPGELKSFPNSPEREGR
jgi:hypothetical protein